MTFTIRRHHDGRIKDAHCDQCRAVLDARTERALKDARRQHKCPTRPARTTP